MEGSWLRSRYVILRRMGSSCRGRLMSGAQEYESIYRAGIAVATNPQSNREQNIRRKRDDVDDDDEVQR